MPENADEGDAWKYVMALGTAWRPSCGEIEAARSSKDRNHRAIGYSRYSVAGISNGLHSSIVEEEEQREEETWRLWIRISRSRVCESSERWS